MTSPLSIRWRWWRRAAVGLACLIAIWFGAGWLQTTMTLPSGAVISIDQVTYGRQHWSKPRLMATAANLLWGERVGGTGSGTSACDTVCIWMSCRTGWLKRPANFVDVAEVVLVDRNGWPQSQGRFREYERFWNGNYGSTGNAVKLDAIQRGSGVASFAVCPAIRPADSGAIVAAIDGEGCVLCSTSIDYPGPLPAESDWTPDALPATRTDGDLSVTLKAVAFRPPSVKPQQFASVKGIFVLPQFEVRWKGATCADCQYETGNHHCGSLCAPLYDYPQTITSDTVCTLSPFEPAWKWTHVFYPGPTDNFDDDDVWHSEGFSIPSEQELRVLEQRGVIKELEYGLESISGPGEHVVTVTMGQQINPQEGATADGSSHFMGRTIQSDGIAVYDVTSKVPLLVISSPPMTIEEGGNSQTPSFHAIVRNAAGEVIQSSLHMLSNVQWTHMMPNGVDHPREYWLVFLQPGEQPIDRLHIEFAQYRMSTFSFFIRPPEIGFYREHNLLPSTMELVRDP